MKTLGRLVLFVLALAACFAFGFSWRDLQKGSLPQSSSVANLFGARGTAALQPEDLFKRSYDKILKDYYKPLDPQKLKYAGIEGMMASLGDPHTMFLEPKMAQEFALETTGDFVGVGARLSPDPMGAKVAVVFDEGPAARAGLKVGDIITGVDGLSVVGKNIDDIVKMIRGKDGTLVKLQVQRTGVSKPVTLTAKRARITTPFVEEKVLPTTDIGYIAVSQFSQPTTDQFEKAVKKLEKSKVKGLIIDLRNNPGGLLETAVEMLSMFVENKVVVTMKGRDGQQEIAKSFTGMKHIFRYPVVVLLNEDSASASEIFAGVLRDYKLATLVGEHTYGKASVQNVKVLVDGSSAKITIARYFLPSGEDIGRKVDDDGQYVSGGVQPDVKAELDLDRLAKMKPEEPDALVKGDSQIQKAIEVIRSKR